MSHLCEPRILLKARPTPAQLADRFAPPRADGIELYLDVRDIEREGWRERLVSMVHSARPEGCEFVVEGPLRSLDGAFFDVTRVNDANRELIDRVVSFGADIGARAAVIHAMVARHSAVDFDDATWGGAMELAVVLFRYYVNACKRAGLVATVENVPPVARMREGTHMFSLLGTAPGDIVALTQDVPGLRVTVDVSHAQLYVNAFRAQPASVDERLRPMVEYLQEQPGVDSLQAYIAKVAPVLYEAHISNARGLLGEGLPYDDGEIDLDSAIHQLSRHVSYLVTETIEPDADHATHMREAQRRIARLLGGED